MVKTPPAFQFYARDFIEGTMSMTAEEVGGYMRLLCYQWNHGSIPDDDDRLAIISGVKSGNAVASIRHKFGMAENGKLKNLRLEEVRAEQDEYRESQSKKARKRWENRSPKAAAKPGESSGNATASTGHMPNPCPAPALPLKGEERAGARTNGRVPKHAPAPSAVPATAGAKVETEFDKLRALFPPQP